MFSLIEYRFSLMDIRQFTEPITKHTHETECFGLVVLQLLHNTKTVKNTPFNSFCTSKMRCHRVLHGVLKVFVGWFSLEMFYSKLLASLANHHAPDELSMDFFNRTIYYVGISESSYNAQLIYH